MEEEKEKESKFSFDWGSMPFAFKQHYLRVTVLPESTVLFTFWHNSKACYNYK